MKDRIGQPTKKRKAQDENDFSFRPDVSTERLAGYSADEEIPTRKKSKLPLILGAVVVVAAVAAGGWYFISHYEPGNIAAPAEPVVHYPLDPQKPDTQSQELADAIRSAKAQTVPSVTQLTDLIDINKLTGPLESSGTVKNANLVAAVEGESLAKKAAEFKATKNDDTIGWIKIPNTNVDYPIVHKSGVENANYYTAKGYDKQYSRDGVIWADYECTFPELSANTVLYGHNWHNIYTPRTMANMQSNDTMFSLVTSYHHTDFAQENPFIYFSTTEKDYVFQVFAGYYTDLKFAYNFAEMSDEDFKTTIAEAKAKSLVNYNVPVTTEDHLLTLSTCTRFYGNHSNQRFVVMAKLVSEGTPSTNISTHSNAIAYNASIQ